jgi:very-short-patch-repair endonuclease
VTQGGRNSTDWWVGLEPGRVVKFQTVDSDPAASVQHTPSGDDAPAIVCCRVSNAEAARVDTVESLLAQLEQAAVALFPRWLPEAELFEGPQGGAVAAVRAVAARTAAVSEHYGPYLADLAERALRSYSGPTGDHREAGAGMASTSASGTTALRSRFSAAIRSAELARVIAQAHQCPSAAMVVEVPREISEPAERALTAAAEWIAYHGAWRVGLAMPGQSRIGPEKSSPDVHDKAVEGRPRSDSPAELALEAALRAQPWAAGRVWNRIYQSGPLAPVYRLDLWWQAERCVVEIDGSEHRSAERYAADRRRDVQLQLDGQSVLRFTNDDVLTDVTAVVTRIERLLRGRRP